MQIVITPCEVLLRPGDTKPFEMQRFQVRAFNSRGQFLNSIEPENVTFSLTGPGSVDAEGIYRLPEGQSEQTAVTITATVGEMTATARVRVHPRPPLVV